MLEECDLARAARHELADAAGINRYSDDERHGLLLHRDDEHDYRTSRYL
jgi:alkylated DNA repair dioxygenase AlkB